MRNAALPASGDRLRVALLAASLEQAGAEKQLVYVARALVEKGVDVRVYTLRRGQFYEAHLRELGLTPIWIGKHESPMLRVMSLARRLTAFRPHILQSSEFFANLYVSLVGRLTRSLAIGTIRNDTRHELQEMGRWGPWLLRSPPAIVANSVAAKENAVAQHARADRIHVLTNAIDVVEFDRAAAGPCSLDRNKTATVVAAVCRLVPAKRLDCLISAVGIARKRGCNLDAVVVGEGPQRASLECQAEELGLKRHVQFVGRRADVPRILSHVDLLALTSRHEGCPNIILEGMAANLPVITTPAGDAARIVVDSQTGFVTPFDDPSALAEKIVTLSGAPELRRRLGKAGRSRVVREFGFPQFSARLFQMYAAMARQLGQRRLVALLESLPGPAEGASPSLSVSRSEVPAS